MSELKEEIFKDKFGTWWNKIKPFYNRGGFDTIYSKLKEDGRRGKQIYPLPQDTFRAFRETPIAELRVVLMGMSPYHMIKEGIVVADGLAMSCSKTAILQPSLKKFYEGLEQDFGEKGLDLNMIQTPDLSYLAKQGVLLLNAALTVEAGMARSHLELWHPFTKFLFEDIFAMEGCPIILLGKGDIWKFEKYCAPFQWVFKIEHPAYAAREEAKWDTKKAFKQVNTVLRGQNGLGIEWILKPKMEFINDLPF